LQGLWFSFPVIYTVAKLGLLSINQEEWLWTVFDFLGKCMFSTSLLQVMSTPHHTTHHSGLQAVKV
jgi:bacteriorhodopsin